MNFRILAVVMLTFMFSCREKKQVDIIAPSVQSLLINGSAESQVTVAASSDLNISYSIADNTALESCTFSIHAANNGHTHSGEGSQGGEYHLTSGTWAAEETVYVSGTSHTGSKSITVPDSIAGIWHVEVIAKDDVGYTTSRAVSLTVTNDNLPQISFTSSTPSISSDGIIYASVGSSVTIAATVSDVDNLSSVFVRVISSTGNTLNQQNVPVSGTSISFPSTFQNLTAGEYRIVIDAFDLLGYQATWDARLKVQ